MAEWVRIADELPPRGWVVNTKVDDENGCRNEQPLKLMSGRLWWLSDGSMYVYYSPTHWERPFQAPGAGHGPVVHE